MESIQRIFIEGPLPGLNFLIAACKQMGRNAGKGGRRFNLYARKKKEWEERIVLICRAQKLKPIQNGTRIYLDFIWYENTKRRDPDNICAAGRKFILDALVKAGIIKNDGWDCIAGFKDRFVHTKGRPGVLVIMRNFNGGSKNDDEVFHC